jgi:uncharacterized protein (TIGR02453 family)
MPPSNGKSSGSEFFGPGTIAFFREIARHNDKPWFLANKARYEREVRDPALAFIRGIAPSLGKFSTHLVADDRPNGGSMTRIYRDIRFSSDKSPYKTWLGIHFMHDQHDRHEGGLPGLYVHVMPGDSMVAGGAWRPAPPDLKKVREAIANKPNEWKAALPKGIKIGGEALQRPPPGFSTDHPFIEDIKRKDFVASYPLKDGELAGPGFRSTFLAKAAAVDPLNRFLAKAIGVPW